MRILVFSSGISPDFSDGSLVNDLVSEFAERGHEVLVYAQDWNDRLRKPQIESMHRVRIAWQPIVNVGFGPSKLIGKWAATSLAGWRRYKNEIIAFDPEWIIGFGPATIHAGIVLNLLPSKRPNLLVQWDFFPFHQAQIGKLIGGLLTKVLSRAEAKLIDRFRYVAHMSPRNSEYFRAHYKSARNVQSVIVPIWGPRIDDVQISDGERNRLRRKYGLDADGIVAIFGGQLTAGRGIDNVLDLAQRASMRLPHVNFVIIGDGDLRPYVAKWIDENPAAKVRLHKRIPRSDYQALVKSCDIGIVSTDATVDVPTFPSKSIDYFRNSVPVLASVEATTDYSTILQDTARAGLASLAGDATAFIKNLEQLAGDTALRRELGANGRRFFLETLSVSRIAEALERTLSS